MNALRVWWRDNLLIPSVYVKFEPRDLWIGVYWNKPIWGLEIYICIIPCLPIKLMWFDKDEIPF